MDGLMNFRDFGDKATCFGGSVKSNTLYRSGHSALANRSGIARLQDLDFGVIVDLRYPGERNSDRSPWPRSWMDRVLVHDGDDANAPHHAMIAAAGIGSDAVDTSYREFYAALPFDVHYRPFFAKALRAAANGQGRLLIHCSAGKDRTGLLVGLLLDLLGVDRAEIMADYLLSAGLPQLQALAPDLLARAELSGHSLSEEAVKAMLGVKVQYLEMAFAAIERETGSIEAYFAAGGVDSDDLKRLRARFIVS